MKKKCVRNIIMMCVLTLALIIIFCIVQGSKTAEFNKTPHTKYLLIWTSPKTDPFYNLGKENETFVKRNCSYQNCYVTSDRELIEVNKFDAILFHGPEIMNKDPKVYFPHERSFNQSYIFASMESSHYYRVPDNRYNGVFNFTWTYKLSSDIGYGYLIVKDKNGNVIGPNEAVPWIKIEDMLPINDEVKSKLENKSIAAAWFVSNCHSKSKREDVADKIAAELKKYNMSIDIYGGCGKKKCSRETMGKCLRKVQNDYYFYFSFENSFSEDYVTEKLLTGLQNYAVPIVYGGANYDRFMPRGIYLNVTNNNASIAELVNEMVESINNKNKYYDFFKWHNHYSYHKPSDTAATDVYCSLCKFLNNLDNRNVSVVEDFHHWWDK